MTWLRGERDAAWQALVPTGLAQIFSDSLQQRERVERSSREAQYYRGLYHGVVPIGQ